MYLGESFVHQAYCTLCCALLKYSRTYSAIRTGREVDDAVYRTRVRGRGMHDRCARNHQMGALGNACNACSSTVGRGVVQSQVRG